MPTELSGERDKTDSPACELPFDLGPPESLAISMHI